MEVLRLPINTQGRDFIVGDLHGCYVELIERMQQVRFDEEKDRLFCVGDLIDRGRDSPACIRLLDEPWFFCVRGNHEEMLIEYIGGNYGALSMWLSNGGQWVLDQKLKDIIGWYNKLKTLPLVIHVEGQFNVLHAEWYKGQVELMHGKFGLDDQATLQWGRSYIKDRKHNLPYSGQLTLRTYVGHTPVRQTTEHGPFMFIDTGACFNDGFLTIVEHGRQQ